MAGEPGLPPYGGQERGSPEEERRAERQRLVGRRRRRLGRTIVPGVVGLLLLLLLAAALWWVGRAIFAPSATPTPAAAVTPSPLPTITETVVVATPKPSPTPTALVPRFRRGQMVRVSGTEQEGLLLRLGPGLDFDALMRMEEGTTLKVLEGPRRADGYVWWRLEMENGTTGWAAEKWLQSVAEP